jgi:hypothetical protein
LCFVDVPGDSFFEVTYANDVDVTGVDVTDADVTDATENL